MFVMAEQSPRKPTNKALFMIGRFINIQVYKKTRSRKVGINQPPAAMRTINWI